MKELSSFQSERGFLLNYNENCLGKRDDYVVVEMQ